MDSNYGPRPRAIVGIVLAFIALVVVVWLVFASTLSVDNGKIAVMSRFGDVTGQELGSGFHVKNPFDKATIYDIQVQKDQSEAASASKDLQDVNGTVVVNYQVEAGKVSEIHKKVGPLFKEKLIDPSIQANFKAATATYDAQDLITHRTDVEQSVLVSLQASLKDYGINVSRVNITNFVFSPEYTKAIEEKQVAAQNAAKAQFNLDRANLDAQAQAVQGASLTPEYLQLQQIETQQKAIDKWNGNLPSTFAGDSGTIFNIPVKQ